VAKLTKDGEFFANATRGNWGRKLCLFCMRRRTFPCRSSRTFLRRSSRTFPRRRSITKKEWTWQPIII
jgi:hypothetical protein